jgi:hypothetical protein
MWSAARSSVDAVGADAPLMSRWTSRMIEAAFARLTIPIVPIASRRRVSVPRGRIAASEKKDEQRQRRNDPADDLEGSPSRAGYEAGRKVGIERRRREDRRRRPERRLAELLGGRQRATHVHVGEATQAIGGNPLRDGATIRLPALLAQLVEHLHGKEGVDGSSPSEGSFCHKNRPQMGGFLLSRPTPWSTSSLRRGSAPGLPVQTPPERLEQVIRDRKWAAYREDRSGRGQVLGTVPSAKHRKRVPKKD